MNEGADRTRAGKAFAWRWAALVVALWIPATLFFGGRLGWWNDDYLFNGRNPATGAIEFLVQRAPDPFTAPAAWQFWRPLNFAATTTLVTVFWNHDWVVHAVGAAAHLIAAWLVWCVLAELKVSRQARAWGSVLFLCCPIGFEAFLWASAIATGVATSMLLGSVLLYIRHARGALSRGGYAVLTLLAGSIPLVNEQPAACLAALPLLAMAMRDEREPWKRTAWRAMAPLLIPAAMHGLYLWVIATNLPTTSYGSVASLVAIDALPGRVAVIAKQMLRELRGDSLGIGAGFGAWREGWRTIVESWSVALVMGGVIVLAVAGVAREWVDGVASQRKSAGTRSRLWLVLFVVAMGVLSLLPLAAVGWVMVRPRMAYVTLAAIALLVGVVGNAIRDWVVARDERGSIARRYDGLTGALLVLVALVGVVMLVGVQAGYVARAQADRASVSRLREMIEEPKPGTFFLPLSVENRAFSSGTPRFDWYFASAWYWSYSFATFARHGFGRDDIESGFADASRAVLMNVDENGFVFDGPMRYDGRRGTGPRHVAWDDVVPFVVGPGGEVTLVSPIHVKRDGMVHEVRLSQVEAARARGAAAVHDWTIE